MKSYKPIIVAVHCFLIAFLIYYVDALNLGADYGVSRINAFRRQLPYELTPCFFDNYPGDINFIYFSYNSPYFFEYLFDNAEEIQCYYYNKEDNILLVETMTDRGNINYYNITKEKASFIKLTKLSLSQINTKNLNRVQIAGNKRIIKCLYYSVGFSGFLFYFFLYIEIVILVCSITSYIHLKRRDKIPPIYPYGNQ